jgi:hypothetical protein
MTSSASKRLFKEYRGLSSDPPEGITAGPVTEDDMFVWEALIQGPEETPFEGGVFPAELKFPKDYPLAPPKMRFLVDMWHPNGTYVIVLRWVCVGETRGGMRIVLGFCGGDGGLHAEREGLVEESFGRVWELANMSGQCTPTARSASQSCILPATTRITTSKPPSGGRRSRAWRRSSSA